MIYVHWIFLALYTFIVVAAMVTVLMDNRQPAKTMAWVLVLSFMPIVGIILYIFFGQNTRKEKFISQRSLDQLTKHSMLEFAEQRHLTLPGSHRTLIRLFTNQSMALPFKDNAVDICTNGYEFTLALLKDIGAAQHHIHLETYIIDDDPLGNLLADALTDKARQGVEVRLIYDDMGSWKTRNRFFERMREGGIDIQPFMPVRFPALLHSKVNYRNHRKLCVIDGRVGYIGGMNIAKRYVKAPKRTWRDTHLRIRGGAVYAIQKAFLVDWYFVDRTLITGRDYYPTPQPDGSIDNNCLAQIVTSSPIQPWPDIMQGYVRILLEAKHYVYMETPYFLPTEPILFALRTAALAGVDVRLMIPMHSDAKLVEWASISYVMAIIEAGVKVYLYKTGFNHSKILVSDDFLSTCGSTNIDFRSFENNFESNAFFYDKPLALRMKKLFLDDQRQCVRIEEVKRLMKRPFLMRLWESIIRLLSPLL